MKLALLGCDNVSYYTIICCVVLYFIGTSTSIIIDIYIFW